MTFPLSAFTVPPSLASAVPLIIARFMEIPTDAAPLPLAAPAIASNFVFSVASTVTSPSFAVVEPLSPIPAYVLSSTEVLVKYPLIRDLLSFANPLMILLASSTY